MWKAILIVSLVFIVSGCHIGSGDEITIRGLLEPQNITTYMYGTHILLDDLRRTIYALKSDRIDLDAFIGRMVSVTGKRVPGYPVDGGPPYLNISSVDY